MLQARFDIVRGPTQLWHHEDLSFIMKACITLHNMIIEDDRVDDNELVAVAVGNEDYDSLGTDGPVEVSRDPRPETRYPLINLWLETAAFEIRTPTMPSAKTSLHICGRYTDKALLSEFPCLCSILSCFKIRQIHSITPCPCSVHRCVMMSWRRA